jgi:hypothetical protein
LAWFAAAGGDRPAAAGALPQAVADWLIPEQPGGARDACVSAALARRGGLVRVALGASAASAVPTGDVPLVEERRPCCMRFIAPAMACEAAETGIPQRDAAHGEGRPAAPAGMRALGRRGSAVRAPGSGSDSVGIGCTMQELVRARWRRVGPLRHVPRIDSYADERPVHVPAPSRVNLGLDARHARAGSSAR